MRLQSLVALFSGSVAVQLLDAVGSGSVIEFAAVVVGSVLGMALTACLVWYWISRIATHDNAAVDWSTVTQQRPPAPMDQTVAGGIRAG